MLVLPDTFRASGCSAAATRSPGRQEPAGRWSTSLLAGASTAWQRSIGRSPASLAARPPCCVRRRRDGPATACARGRKHLEHGAPCLRTALAGLGLTTILA